VRATRWASSDPKYGLGRLMAIKQLLTTNAQIPAGPSEFTRSAATRQQRRLV
jgi:hypothetical protein